MVMKYIVTQHEGIEEMFVFPDTINHDCMAEVISRIKNHSHGNWKRVPRRPISAGFITVEGECYGRSETLRLDSRGTTDTVLFDMECKNQ
jgi:hypothetical protein